MSAVPAGFAKRQPAHGGERFMRLALAAGERNLGLTWPNPSVGAVVVAEREGEPIILGRGATQARGTPHAERVALEMAGADARGSTLYVTLEPCAARSSGRHGPACTDLIVQAGIRRLVIGAADPSPFAHGAGLARLARAGVEIVSGILSAEAHRAHLGHILRVTEGRPLVTLKLARTADGYAGRRKGGRLMITGEIANGRIHLLRARHDAIMVGVGTVIADDQLLNVRLPGLENRSPVRIVIDTHLRTPLFSRLVATAGEIPTWIIAGEAASADAERALVASGVEVMRVAAPSGRLDVAQALRLLGTRGITRVFSEGGPALADALAGADLIDGFVLVTARISLGEEGVPALGPLLRKAVEERFGPTGAETFGPDRVETFERSR